MIGALNDPDVIRGRLHDFGDMPERTMALVNDQSANEIFECGVKRTEFEIGTAGEDVATGNTLGGIQVMRARKEHAAAICRLGHRFHGRDSLPLEGGGRQMDAHPFAE